MHHSSKETEKGHRIISIERESSCDKILRSLLIIALSKLEIEGNITNLIKGIYAKPPPNITLNGESPNAFPRSLATEGHSALSWKVWLERSGKKMQ